MVRLFRRLDLLRISCNNAGNGIVEAEFRRKLIFGLTIGIPVVREVQVNQVAVESVKLTAHRVCLKSKRLINISYAN